jgi:hypothetical protein
LRLATRQLARPGGCSLADAKFIEQRTGTLGRAGVRQALHVNESKGDVVERGEVLEQAV